MAITIKQYPAFKTSNSANTIMPVYNTIAFTVDSTNKTQCQFQYICDVYVEGVFVTRLKQFPTGSNNYATFKVNRILEDYVSFDLHENLYGSSLFALNTNSIKSYTLKFGEEYDTSAQCDAGTTVYADLTLSSSVANFKCFNGALQKDEFLVYFDTTYYASSSSSKFLTGFPNEAMIRLGDQMTFNIFSSNLEKLKVVTYDDAGVALGTYTYDSPYGGVFSTTAHYLQTIGVGPENLNNSTLLTGSQPVITQDVSYYTVQCLGTLDVPTSEIKTITIDNRDSKFDVKRLWWLGRLGNFDSYTYTRKSLKTIQINRTEFNKIYGEYTTLSPGATWTYDKKDRGRTTLSVNAQESNVYNSNWLTEEESIWMQELFTSPESFLVETNQVCCIASIAFTPTDDMSYWNCCMVLKCNTNLIVGNSITVNITDTGYNDVNGEWTVSSVSGNTVCFQTDIPGISAPPSDGDITDGLVWQNDFSAELDPLIIKTTQIDEKVKNNIKNINYSIEVDKAYAINVQRN